MCLLTSARQDATTSPTALDEVEALVLELEAHVNRLGTHGTCLEPAHSMMKSLKSVMQGIKRESQATLLEGVESAARAVVEQLGRVKAASLGRNRQSETMKEVQATEEDLKAASVGT